MPAKRQPVQFIIDWNACINCGSCVAVCPQPEPFSSPFDTIAIDKACGIACMDCETICPTTAIIHQHAPTAMRVVPTP